MFTLFMPAFYGVVCISGIVGNGVVIYVLVKYKIMHTVPGAYILNLASTDFLFLLGLPFLGYFNITRKWVFGDSLCRLIMGIDGMNMLTGIFTLTAMSVDRYLAIVHPVWSKTHRTVTKARFICLLTWTLSAIITIPLWLYAKTQSFFGVTVCNIICPNLSKRIFIICSFCLGFALPLMVVLVAYTNIIHFLKIGNRRNRRQFKLGRVGVMILLAILLFVLCWLPFWVSQLMVVATHGHVSRPRALKIAYFCSPFLSYTNSCLNPIVYTYVRSDFRRSVAKLFGQDQRKPPKLEINGRSVNGSTSNMNMQLSKFTTDKPSVTVTVFNQDPHIDRL
ncbi:somatostatin receptor type 4-like [Saccoglossus kowalevskii]